MSGIGAADIQSQRVTSGSGTPALFRPRDLTSPTRRKALERATPELLRRGLGGPDPKQRRRLKTRAFEDIGLSEKSAIGNLRRTFAKSGVKGGVQGSDVSDIIEAGIGARGAASTSVEDFLQENKQKDIANLLTLLTSQEPFGISTTTQNLSQNPIKGPASKF